METQSRNKQSKRRIILSCARQEDYVSPHRSLNLAVLLQGGGLGNSWESYVMTTPVGTGGRGNYTLTIYDGDRCNGQSAALTQTWGDFPDSLGNSIDSWRLCPPGKNP